MKKLVRAIELSCKYPFHKTRDAIRYLRSSHEIKQIKKENPQALLFFHNSNLGEVYVSCAYIKYLKSSQSNIVFLTSQKYTLQLINLFPEISKTYLISKRFVKLANGYTNFLRKFNVNSLDIYNHASILEKSGNMVQAYRFLLDINYKFPKNSTLCLEEDSEKVHSVFTNISCKLEKTIIISPETRTFNCSLLTADFWIQLADAMVKNGYDVIFNSPQRYGEYSSVFLSIGETILLTKLCGYVIGARSGLLDVLAGETEAFIQAIYPNNSDLNENDNKFWDKKLGLPPNATTAEKWHYFFSLLNIRNDGKIKEIILKSQNKEALIKELLLNWSDKK